MPSPARPVLISVAPNGGRLTPADHPGLPFGPAALARTAAEVLAEGAALLHVHVRDAQGLHLLDAEAYAAVIAAIRQSCGDRILVQISTEALGRYDTAQQTALLQSLRPPAASLALREFLPDAQAEPAFARLLDWLKAHEVLPQIILYTPAEATALRHLMTRGLVPFDDIPVLYVLGRHAADQTAKPADLLAFRAPGQPVFGHWTTCAFGRHEAACTVASALLGGHLRVGFENNLHLPGGERAASNADLVRAVRRPLTEMGLTPVSAAGLIDGWRGLMGI